MIRISSLLKLLTASSLAVVLLSGALPTTALAVGPVWDVVLTIPGLEQQPNDAEITFAGTEVIKADVGDAKSGVISSLVASGTTVNLTFSDKLPVGTPIRFHVYADTASALVFGSGTWTNDGNVITAMTAGQVAITKKSLDMPGASPIALVLLSLVILGSGIFVLRSRNARTA